MRWVRAGAYGDAFIGSHGRLFDLIVLGRPGRAPQDPRMPPLEAALFESGRPVLIAPAAAPQVIGANVLVAWNGSTEQTRTIAFAMPLLREAEQSHRAFGGRRHDPRTDRGRGGALSAHECIPAAAVTVAPGNGPPAKPFSTTRERMAAISW